MKNFIIAMSVIAFAFGSCQKQSSVLPRAQQSTQDDVLQTDATHYYHGKQVTHQREIASYLSSESATLMTNKISGQLEFYYFDNEAEELDFLKSYPSLQPIYTKILQAKEMREFAMATGEIEHYTLTGQLSQQYIDFVNQFRTRAGYTLCSNLNGGGLVFNVAGPVNNLFAAMPVMDNNAESYKGPNAIGNVYTNPFFGGAALAIFAPLPGVSFINFPLAWRNVISSAN